MRPGLVLLLLVPFAQACESTTAPAAGVRVEHLFTSPWSVPECMLASPLLGPDGAVVTAAGAALRGADPRSGALLWELELPAPAGERAFVTGTPALVGKHKAEFDMLGRSYSIGYEPDLEDTLIHRPLGKLTDPRNAWVVWYPLQRAKNFYVLPEEKQKSILGEHGTLAKRYGAGGHATDIRLACHGLDRLDNDFIVGLLGPKLHPLSAVVQEMRRTEQTSQYLDRLGPFFIGHTIWQSKSGHA